MIARVVAAFALLAALLATRGERLPGLDRAIGGLAALQHAAARAPSGGTCSPAAPNKAVSILDAQPHPSVQARPENQPGPNGRHVKDDGVVGGDAISLPAPVAARGEGERAAVRAGGCSGHMRLPGGVRAAHPARGPPVSGV